MARIYAQDVIECAIRGVYNGIDVVNVLHFRNDEASVNDSDKARDVLNNWQDHILEMVSNTYTVVGMDWRSLDPDDNNAGTLAPDTAKPVTGTHTSAPSSPNVALLVHKRTAGRGRGQRDGRIFLAGVIETIVDGKGDIEAQYLSPLQTSANEFLSGVNDSGFAGASGSGMIVLNTTPESRLPGTQPVTLTYRAVTALQVDGKVATQRDRLR
jgi:hypothetical protein